MEDALAALRNGPYVNLPFEPALDALRGDARALTGMLERLGRVATDTLTIAIPFFEPHVLDKWLDLWTCQNTRLRVVVIHRQEPHHQRDAERMREVMRGWNASGRVEFRTYPRRDPVTEKMSREDATFHCKLVDPGTGQIILLTSNLTSPARTRNVEAAYVFAPEQAHDFRVLIAHLRKGSHHDPMAGPARRTG